MLLIRTKKGAVEKEAVPVRNESHRELEVVCQVHQAIAMEDIQPMLAQHPIDQHQRRLEHPARGDHLRVEERQAAMATGEEAFRAPLSKLINLPI